MAPKRARAGCRLLGEKRETLNLLAGVEAVTLSRRFKMFVRGGGQNRLIEPAPTTVIMRMGGGSGADETITPSLQRSVLDR
jgi:hypothetical protein